jgi:phosphoglycerate dehydrogenase-like enzyme
MPRALITPTVLHETTCPYYKVFEEAGFDVVFKERGVDLMKPAGLMKAIVGIDAVIAGMEPFNREVLYESKLRVIARMGVGYDAIDIPAATELGVAVAITPGANEEAVAEHTVALMLGVFRAIPAREHEVRQGGWRRHSHSRMAGRTLGLIGMGRIGKAVVPRATGLGMKVIATDPLADVEFAKQHNVRLVSLDKLLTEADVVSLHAPATEDTLAIINAETLAKMKQDAVLINTARGSLVDETALADAISGGRIFGAGLDVFCVEPLPPDSPLLRLDNVVLSPHMAGLDKESEIAMSTMAAECIVALYRGDWPEGCVVNSEIRDTWRW